ncbi:MAG: diaminopimelate epimerase [candidate division Zixibacteria bacterium]|nr:diaminopimelate epimerase [candidate division Zixibacteria bacterium]
MRRIAYGKYHGLENDFIVIDLKQVRLPVKSRGELAKRICERHTGIGADGVVFFAANKNRLRMLLFNADGSPAEVSGNGLRILAQHLYLQGLVSRRRFSITTGNGQSEVRIISISGFTQVTEISLAAPRFRLAQIPMRGRISHFINRLFTTVSGSLAGTAVNIGNPHIVFFVDNFDFDWRTFGAEVEGDRHFPDNVNVEFAVIKSRRHLQHRSWERGVGETQASGTGAAAAVAAGIINGYLDHDVTVTAPAGDLEISIASLDEPILLRGPSVKIGDGTFLFQTSSL